MKRLRSLVLGLFALCSMVGMAQEAKADDTGYIVKVGQVAPDFTVTLSDFRGKVVMLQFTASWCGGPDRLHHVHGASDAYGGVQFKRAGRHRKRHAGPD